ncbi:MAG TPA: SurA N-terminal domain-containing protein [Actinomycetota bacterium]|nr:SurA N-terminal domain-containing protein [Actinomycetota bacterium]
MRSRHLIVLAAACALAATSCAALTPAAAIVNSEKIPESEVEQEVLQLREDPEAKEFLKEASGRGQLRRQILGTLIRTEVSRQYAERNRISVTEADVDRDIEQARAQVGGEEAFEEILKSRKISRDRLRVLIRRNALQQRIAEIAAKDVRLDEAVSRSFYDQNPSRFPEVRVSQMTLRTRPEAEQAMAQVNSGRPFAEIARAQSVDPAARSGGDVGWLSAEQFGPAGEQVQAAPIGGIVGPLQVAGGFAVYQVRERRTAPFEEVRPQIEQQLSQQAREQALQQFLERELKGAKIVVNPKYGKFDAEELLVTRGPQSLPE